MWLSGRVGELLTKKVGRVKIMNKRHADDDCGTGNAAHSDEWDKSHFGSPFELEVPY